MGQEEMLIHFVPCLCVNQPGVGAEVLDFACPEAGLLLQGGKHLKTGTPYPNKQYLVSCRNSGRKKAVSGFLARIPRRLREFTTITRWRLDRGPILTHHVEHQVLDEDFDMLTEDLLYWCGYKTWQPRWPENLKDTALVAAQPRMAIAPGDGRSRKQLTDRIEDGVIVERREAIQMPTVERERLFAPDALREWPMPAIRDAFTAAGE